MIRGICVAPYEELRRNRDYAHSLGHPRLAVLPETETPLAIVGGGRSSLDFPLDFPGHVMAINGAHDWLVERGRVPDYFMGLDPQEYVAGLLRKPQSATKYLMATNCHPEAFKALHGFDVTIWDSEHGDDPRLPGEVPGGGTAMTRSPVLMALMGYRDMTLYGADSCYLTDSTHVYVNEPPPELVTVWCERLWTTTWGLLGQAEYLAMMIPAIHPVRVRLEGEHLAQAMLRTNGAWSLP